MDALKIVADEIDMSAWEVFFLYAGCSGSLWVQLIDEPESVGQILSDTTHDNYAFLVKLNGSAAVNFWRNAEVRGAAQAHLALEIPWAKIKAVLSKQEVNTAEKFDTAISELTPEDTPQVYTKRATKTMRRSSDQLDRKHICDECGKPYGTKKALRLHIKLKRLEDLTGR